MQETTFMRYGTPVARILLSAIFIMAGVMKLMEPAMNQEYIAAYGIPMVFFAFVVAVVLEIGGGLSVLLGYKAKMGAWALIIFTLATTFIFHMNFVDPIQMQMFLKNLTITGGLLLVAIYGAGPMSIDARKTKNTEPEQM